MNRKTEMIAATVDDIRRVLQVINEYSKKAEHETGLTGPQLWAIKAIAESTSICVSDLAAKMYLHAATVIGILDRLEERGLVTRVRSRSDRRFVVVELSEQGRRLVKTSPQVAQGIIIEGLERMPIRMLENVSEGLKKIVELLGATRISPRLMLSSEINKPQKKRKLPSK